MITSAFLGTVDSQKTQSHRQVGPGYRLRRAHAPRIAIIGANRWNGPAAPAWPLVTHSKESASLPNYRETLQLRISHYNVSATI
jgi:hypothetical protein